MPRNSLNWGDWNAICDVCGFKHKASTMRKRWDGLMVCETDYELRNPQDFLRVRGDTPAVPWTRPEPTDIFVGPACYLWDQSAFTGLGVCGCAITGKTFPFTSQQMYELKFPSSPA